MHLPEKVRRAWPGLDNLLGSQIPTGASTIGFNRMLQQPVLANLLDAYSKTYPKANRAAVASQWSMDFLCTLLPAALVPPLAAGWGLDLEKDLCVVLDGGKWLALAPGAAPVHLEHFELSRYLDRLLERQVEPVFRGLSVQSGLSGKVLWTNFTAVWDSVWGRMKLDVCDGDYLDSAAAWLECARVLPGNKRLRDLQRPTLAPAPIMGRQWPLRAHCCLHFQLCDPGEAAIWCEACPKLRQQPLAEQVRYLTELRAESGSD